LILLTDKAIRSIETNKFLINRNRNELLIRKQNKHNIQNTHLHTICGREIKLCTNWVKLENYILLNDINLFKLLKVW